jgi:hypothetical protein
MSLPIGYYFLSRVFAGTCSSGDGSPSVAATLGSSARLPEEVESAATTSGSSAHLPEEVGMVAAAPVMAGVCNG